MSKQNKHLYAFGPFVLDPGQRLLLRDGDPVPLAPKAVDTLLVLVANAGMLVEKQQLMEEVWPDTFVEEGSLTRNIFVLRQTLGKYGSDREYIETVPKRGYRFAASVRQQGNGTAFETEPQAVAGTTSESGQGTLPAAPIELGLAARSGVPRSSFGRITLLLATTLAVAGGWFWLSAPPQPSLLKITQITHFGRVDPPSRLVTDGTRIYFVERTGGRFSLAAVPVNGGDPVPIPTPFPNTALYDISPDRSELLVGSDSGGEDDMSLWMVPTSGGSPRRLGNVMGHDAAWSPDGRNIAFFSGSGLYVIRPDGSNLRRLATVQGKGWFSRWAPDGKTLRFSAWSSPVSSLSLWAVAMESGSLHPLLPGWREPPTYYGDGESDGDWTPDGRYFLFRSTRAGAASIWAMAERGRFLRRSSRAPVQLLTTDSSLWSVLAAKNKIFFAGDKEVRELARYDARQKQFVPFLPGVRARDVSYSRDGQWVAYVVTSMQQSVLWKSRADGTDRQELTFPPMEVGQPLWSPDGKQIVLHGNTPGKTREIFMVSAGGGDPERLTSSYSIYPDWSPGGDRVYFTAPVPGPPSHPTGPNITGREEEGTYQLDLKTRQISIVTGAESLKALTWSPDGRYQVAQSRDNRKLLLFDSQSGRWTELFQCATVRAGLWSRDSKYVYTQDLSGGVSQAIFRVRIGDRHVERIATFEQIPRADVRNYFLAGLAADDAPVVSLVLSHSDIYALDLNLP